MNVYRIEYTDSSLGTCVHWEDTQFHANGWAFANDIDDPNIELVKIPTTRKLELVAWLNANLNTDRTMDSLTSKN